MSVFQGVPGLQVITSYRRQWLLKDVIAGVVLTTLLVPQGMAYAELAGLPPITGYGPRLAITTDGTDDAGDQPLAARRLIRRAP